MTSTASAPRAARWLPAGASAAAFPLGGIGTGNVSVGARGELRDWELANAPGKGTRLPFIVLRDPTRAVPAPSRSRACSSRGCCRRTRATRATTRAIWADSPACATRRLLGEYPLVTVEFDDDDLPVRVRLEAFTPFIPLDADASGIPVAVLRYTVTNPTALPLDVSVVGLARQSRRSPRRGRVPLPEVRRTARATSTATPTRIRGVHFATDLPADSLRFGSASLTTADASTTAKPQWLYGFWQDGVQVFWDDLRDDGRLDPGAGRDARDGRAGRLDHAAAGRLARHPPHAAARRDRATSSSGSRWHFPNRPRAWLGNINLPNTERRTRWSRTTTRRSSSTRGMSRSRCRRGLPELEASTRAFHAALFGSSLPPEVLDAVSANLAVIRSTTCFRLADGTVRRLGGQLRPLGQLRGHLHARLGLRAGGSRTCSRSWSAAPAAPSSCSRPGPTAG